jgi:antitoxin component YwqK of YwqJK toxin-antitoxin module
MLLYLLNCVPIGINMKQLLLILLITAGVVACRNGKISAREIYMAPGKEWLDSTHKASDTTFSKKYGGIEFYTTEFNVNKKAGTFTQVMLDSMGHITQIIVTKDKKRVLFKEYYTNGQARSNISLDSNGQFNGLAKYYYEDGRIQKEGNYKNGVFSGDWNNYDKDGYATTIEKYGKEGELISTEKAR